MEVIELTLTKGTELDFQIALVDNPAIESDFMAFKKYQQFKVISEDKRIVSGFAMMADKKIYRRDDDGREYEVIFPIESVREIQEQFQINKLSDQTNKNHETDNFIDGVFVLETFLTSEKRGVYVSKEMYGDYSDGSWFISMKIDNDNIWQSVLDGTFKGFSVEGMFDQAEEKYMSDLKELVRSL